MGRVRDLDVKPRKKRIAIAVLAAVLALAVAALFVCTAYLVNSSYNPFLYFRF